MASNADVKDGAHLRELAALIAQSVETVLAEYKSAGRAVPSLDDADPGSALLTRPIREAVRVLEGACAQLCASVAPAPHTMVNRSFEMVNPVCIRIAQQARVAEQLRGGPKSVRELAQEARVDADKLGRVLRNLATKHCFREVSKDVYANNKLSACLLPEDATSGLIGHLRGRRRSVDETYPSISALSDVIADAEWIGSADKRKTAFARAHGDAMFDFFERDPVRGARFPIAMQGWTKLNGGAEAIAELYPWHTVAADATFVDLGGSVGHVALALLRANPHLKAVVQDLPSVVEQGLQVWTQEAPGAVAAGRVRLAPIDFFADAPVAGADFYYMKHVLHDWPDADCVAILRNIRRAMTTPGAKVLIHEFILTNASLRGGEQAPFPLLPNFGVGAQRKYNQDINMMAGFNSRERTLDDFVAMGTEAGLEFTKLWEGGDPAIVEFEAAEQ
ncbi:S-adenosyl-L-methionine-dependent methyltransferase [Auricularia subglabra TFB-10046 SS5]|nr:S-adenosyl-L-methionine-dependent methyltransferase [Auricularia subglabra TFB-10046 SS5]